MCVCVCVCVNNAMDIICDKLTILFLSSTLPGLAALTDEVAEGLYYMSNNPIKAIITNCCSCLAHSTWPCRPH